MSTLVQHRLRGLTGPLFQSCGPTCLVHGQGNAFRAGGPLSGVIPASASVVDETTITVNFTACATVVTLAEVEISIDGGTWASATGVTGSPGSILQFTVPTLAPGDVIRIRGAAGALTDCATPAEDIGTWEIPVANGLELPGDFMLMETGGSDTILLEDPAGESVFLEG